MMTNGFIELNDVESLDQLLVQSHGTPIIIFKHSNACSISSGAYAHMSQVECTIGIVTVQEAREVSAEIERRLGVAHESPQVLIVRNGSVVWSASHGQVRAEVVTAALAESVGGGQ
jgi:bacillithiol system protein YtxJ